MSTWATVHPDQQPIDVRHYNLSLTFNDTDATYTGEVEIRFVPTKRRRTVWFHAGAFTIHEARVAGAPVRFVHRHGRVQVRLPRRLDIGKEASVSFRFAGRANARDQDGLFVIRARGRLPAFYTQFESQGARTMFPCFDEPFDKATADVRLTGAARYTLLSNGVAVGDRRVGANRHEVHWQNRDPISTYLITLVAAELEAVRGTVPSRRGTVPLTIYVGPGRTDEAQVALHAVRESLAFFEDYFDRPYPWASYGIVAVEGFTWAGMENKGLANLNAAFLYWSPQQPYRKQAQIVSLVAHELAHEWFGNLVTMQWWHDLWLNEAFATFMEQKVSANVFGDDYERIKNQAWLEKNYFPQDRGVFAHPIVVPHPDTIDELFDGITYAKGVQVVRMLEALVGEDNFRRAIQAYLHRFAFGNATTGDFLRTIEVETGVDLSLFAQSWLHQSGFPVMQGTSRWVPDARQWQLTITQTTEAGRIVPTPFRGIVTVGVQGKGYDRQIELHLTRPRETFTVDLPSAPTHVALNRDGTFLGQQQWADESSSFAQWLRNEPSAVARIAALERRLQSATADEAVAWLRQLLRDDSDTLRLGATDAVLRADREIAWQRQVARGVQELLVHNLRDLPREPIRAALQEQSLILLGVADDPGWYGLLHARLGSPVGDVRLGAMAGLLRSTEPTRFASFRETIRRGHLDQAMRIEMMMLLARTPDPAIFPELHQLLTDPAVVAADDSAIPVRVFRALRQENRALVLTVPGVAFAATVARENLDRPTVAAGILRALEGIKESPREVRAAAQSALQDLLRANPPPGVASLARRLLRAAR